MSAPDPADLLSPFVALALVASWTLVPACGGSEGASTEETTAGETTAGDTGDTADTADTTGAVTTVTTTDPGTTTTGVGTSTADASTSTTGAPGVCDGSMASTPFDCVACRECGSWNDPPADGSYPPAMTCLLEGMRDGAVVGADSQLCNQGKCLIDRKLTTSAGTMITQQMIFDENDQSMKYLGIQELQLKETSYFETCLAAYDANCASPNTWFEGTSVEVVMLVCP